VEVEEKTIDSFVPRHMPPRDQWPDFINEVSMGRDYNAAAELVDRAVEEGYGDRVAIYSPEGDWTYRELLQKSNQIARVLVHELGLVPGNRVLLRSLNNPMLAACWLAVVKAGGVVVTTIAMLRGKEIATIAAQGNAQIALCDFNLREDMQAAAELSNSLEQIVYFNAPASQPSLESMLRNKPVTFDSFLSDGSDIAMIAFTSGTTGKPKGAMHSHQALLAVCETFSRQVLKPNPEDIFMGTASLAFVYGLGGLLLFPLHARAAVVLLENVKIDALLAAAERYRPTVLFTAPTAYKVLLEVADDPRLASLRVCASAGEALPPFVTQGWLDKTGVRITDGIGATELLHVFLSVQNVQDPIGSLGKAVPGYEVRVLDDNGKDAPVGEIGYLAVRGPTGCRYLNDSRQANDVVDGWNITGDTVKIDEQGFIWYQARNDGIIVSAGYNIVSPEVEGVVNQHPAVAECGVIGVPDPDRGNIVRAYVVLKEGYQPSTQLVAEIQAFAKQKAAPYKYPRSIKFIDELPRTATGKIQHFVLREIAKQELGNV